MQLLNILIGLVFVSSFSLVATAYISYNSPLRYTYVHGLKPNGAPKANNATVLQVIGGRTYDHFFLVRKGYNCSHPPMLANLRTWVQALNEAGQATIDPSQLDRGTYRLCYKGAAYIGNPSYCAPKKGTLPPAPTPAPTIATTAPPPTTTTAAPPTTTTDAPTTTAAPATTTTAAPTTTTDPPTTTGAPPTTVAAPTTTTGPPTTTTAAPATTPAPTPAPPVPAPTPAPTRSRTRTFTHSPTHSLTKSRTRTLVTPTKTPSPTPSRTLTPSDTPTPTRTPTDSPSGTGSPSQSGSETPSITPPPTPTLSISKSPTVTVSNTDSFATPSTTWTESRTNCTSIGRYYSMLPWEFTVSSTVAPFFSSFCCTGPFTAGEVATCHISLRDDQGALAGNEDDICHINLCPLNDGMGLNIADYTLPIMDSFGEFSFTFLPTKSGSQGEAGIKYDNQPLGNKRAYFVVKPGAPAVNMSTSACAVEVNTSTTCVITQRDAYENGIKQCSYNSDGGPVVCTEIN